MKIRVLLLFVTGCSAEDGDGTDADPTSASVVVETTPVEDTTAQRGLARCVRTRHRRGPER
jgi:hypothetical protein